MKHNLIHQYKILPYWATRVQSKQLMKVLMSQMTMMIYGENKNNK